MNTRLMVLVLLLAASLSVNTARAQCVSPWVTSDAKVSAGEVMPDTYSVEAFHDSPPLKGLGPKAFCKKLFELYYDGRRKNWKDFQRGMTLWSHTPQEPRANAQVIELDPILLLNVHGSGYCGIQSGLLEGLYQTRPGGTPGKPVIEARRWFLDGIVHSVCDAFYEGKWHYFDIDLGGWAGDEKKGVWSVADVLSDPDGYCGSKASLKSKYFFKADAGGKWVKKIKKAGSYAFQDNLMVGHEMAMALRPGETFTRYFNAAAAGWTVELPFTKKLQKGMKGYYELIYAPTKTQAAAGRLHAEGDASIFSVRVPYNIATSKVEHGGTASVSTDLGKTWVPVGPDGMVKEAVNHWDYLLKVQGGELKKVTTRGILHPGALPRVGSTKTTMTVSQMSDYQVLTYIPKWNTEEALAKVAAVKGLKYSPKPTMSLNGATLQGKGELIVPIKAPPGARIVKLGAMVIGGASTKPDPKNVIELYLGSKNNSNLAERSVDCSSWGLKPKSRVAHWQVNVNGSARLESCDEGEVKVIVKGWGRICSIRIYVGYKPMKASPVTGSLHVAHGFDGQAFEQAVPLSDLKKGPVSYTVDKKALENQFIRMSVK